MEWLQLIIAIRDRESIQNSIWKSQQETCVKNAQNFCFIYKHPLPKAHYNSQLPGEGTKYIPDSVERMDIFYQQSKGNANLFD